MQDRRHRRHGAEIGVRQEGLRCTDITEQLTKAEASIKSSYTKEEILKCGTGQLDGIEYPRLPLPDMLMLDRITKISDEGGRYGHGEVEAEFEVNPDSWFFACHFKDDPVMPGSLALDALCQLLGFYLGWKGCKGKGRALGIGAVKYKGEILPTSGTVTYHLDIRKIVKRSVAVAIADGQVILDGHVVHTAKSLRVGIVPFLQHELHQPPKRENPCSV